MRMTYSELSETINKRFAESKLDGGRFADISDLWADNSDRISEIYNKPTMPWDGESDYYFGFKDGKLYLNWE